MQEKTHGKLAVSGHLENICLEMIDKEEQGQSARPYFDDLLLEDFCFRRANGQIVGKKDFLESLGAAKRRRFVPPGVDVLSYGDIAVASLVICIADTLFRNIRIFIREDESAGWRLLMWANWQMR